MPGTAPSASSSGPTAAEDLSQLFVNQMVSSSVHWRELGVEVRQEAEMYSPGTAATARLTIAIHPPEGSANGDKPQAQFVLNWRVPGCAVACCFYVPGRMGAVTAPAFVCCPPCGTHVSTHNIDGTGQPRSFLVLPCCCRWAKGDEVMLRVNGKEYLECAQGAAAAAHDALGAAAAEVIGNCTSRQHFSESLPLIFCC